jgi:ribonuclease Z
LFSAHLINDPYGDPGVYVDFKFRREALLFDLGDLHVLPPRKLLKISHIFVSHTHMDHFIGFDHLLRVCLGRDKHLSLYGPPGFISNVESKLGAYTWNLVENYTNDFLLSVTEVHPGESRTREYRCQDAFRSKAPPVIKKFSGLLLEEPFFIVRGAFLRHKVPSLAFALEEKVSVNIKKSVLEDMGLPVGSWLMELKRKILQDEPDETSVRVWWKGGEKIMPLGELRERVVKLTSGQKLAYVADTGYSEEDARLVVELAKGADILFIEACFLDADADRAAEKHHLTALQAGRLAGRAEAKRMVLFHFSPKYQGFGHLLEEEARRAFEGSGDAATSARSENP